MSGRGGRYVRGVGRLEANVAPEVAEADLRSIAAALEQQDPKSNTGQSSVVRPLRDTMTGDYGRRCCSFRPRPSAFC